MPTNLTKASRELFKREPDEAFASLAELSAYSRAKKEQSTDRWVPPVQLRAVPIMEELILAAGDGEPVRMNDWSFTQLCSLAKVSKDTVTGLPRSACVLLRRAQRSMGVAHFSHRSRP